MKKHAYLIIVHQQIELLKKIIILLDSEKNDFYIHIDKKLKNPQISELFSMVKYSKVFFIHRSKVNWGGYSQIKCEMELLREAIQNKYSYYHLLSGADLPIKKKEEIYAFFEQNSGKEFVQFEAPDFNEKFKDRVSLYHFFREKEGNSLLFRILEKYSLQIQKRFIDRTKNVNILLQKGANWFSITHELATYILNREQEIFTMFSHTSCADEIFLQTILYNSPFINNLYNSNYDDCKSIMRYIDWKRGTPYVFRVKDFNELISSEYLFARKFDLDVDAQIVEKLFEYLKK